MWSYALKRVWLWIKAHWQVCLTVLSGAMLLLILRGTKRIDLFKEVTLQLKKISDGHKKDIIALTASYETEMSKVQDATDRYESAVKVAQEMSNGNTKAIDQKEAAVVKQLLLDGVKDPNILAQKISALTGFKIKKDDE